MTKLILVVSVIVFVGVAGCLAVRSPLVRGLGQDPVSGGMLGVQRAARRGSQACGGHAPWLLRGG